MSSRRAKGGAYLLILKLPRGRVIEVGALDAVHFPKGIYAYAGSALSGIEPRVARHFSSRKKEHWHIDRLRSASVPVEALVLRSEADLECLLNEMVGSMAGAAPLAPGFGCSDCRCLTHLHLIDRDALHGLEGFLSERLLPPRGRGSEPLL